MNQEQENKDYPLDGWVRAAEQEAEAERNAAEAEALASAESLEDKDEEEDVTSMKQLVVAFASDDDEEEERSSHVNWSLPSILGGDILSARWFRRHLGLLLLILGFTMVYITNRYIGQKEIIEIDKLKHELKDKRYKSLSRSVQLKDQCRQSKIEEYLKSIGDTTLKCTTPPYEIITNEE